MIEFLATVAALTTLIVFGSILNALMSNKEMNHDEDLVKYGRHHD